MLHQESIQLHPDTIKLIRLQHEITAIQSELDSKTLRHRLDMLGPVAK